MKNHGVDETVMKSAVDATRRFFDLPLEEKMKVGTNRLFEYQKTFGGVAMSLS